MPATLVLILLLAGTSTPKAKPTPYVPLPYTQQLPAGTSDESLVADLAMHEMTAEFFDPRMGHQSTLRIVSGSSHWDALFADKSEAGNVRATILKSAGLPDPQKQELATAILAAHGATLTDPGTFRAPVDKVEVVSPANSPGPRTDTPFEVDQKSKPLWVDLSAIGFSADHTLAVLCGSWRMGPANGGGDVLLYRKDATGWHLVWREIFFRQG